MKFTHIMDGEDKANQLSVRRWFWRSVLLYSLLALGIIVVSARQYIEYVDVRSEHSVLKLGTTELHACLERKRELKEKVDVLQTHCAKINGVKYRPKSPADVLNMLQSNTSGLVVQEIVLKKKKIDLVLMAQNTPDLLSFADRLRAQEVCTQVDVTSIEQVGDRVKALLRIDMR